MPGIAKRWSSVWRGVVRVVLPGALLVCGFNAAAHDSLEHVVKSSVDRAGGSGHRLAFEKFTYASQVDHVIGGQPFKSVSRLLTAQDQLQFSEVLSDGRLIRLVDAEATVSAPVFSAFGREPVDVPLVMDGLSIAPQVEVLPSIIVAAQSRDGSLNIYDRARSDSGPHSYTTFVRNFDSALQGQRKTLAKPGAYIQVKPYMGEGPVDFRLESVSENVVTLLRQPFKFHYAGDSRHVVVDGEFVVLPKRPILVEVGEQKFVFTTFVLEK